MSNEKVLTNTRNMRAKLLVDPHATRKHFVVFFGVPLEFSALSLFRVFDWAAKSPIHSYYTSNGFTCCCSIFSSLFLEYYKQ
jgi:hypothetical protein